MYLILVAIQHLLAQGGLPELSASQQMGFGLRFAELKSSIIMWLQSYASKILIITPAKAPIFYSYLGTGAENKIYGSID
jgi:hypothetical protein